MISNIEQKVINKEKLDKNEIEEFCSQIVESVRESINDDTMTNKCDAAQGLVCRYLDKVGLPYHACNTLKVIGENVVGHSFTVTSFDDKNYLIDPAYVQFKLNPGKDLYVNGMKCISKSPYSYACGSNKYACESLIDKGYMELTRENASWYGNSFYKTSTGVSSIYKFFDMDGNVYIKSFLKGNDNLREYHYKEISFDDKKNTYFK